MKKIALVTTLFFFSVAATSAFAANVVKKGKNKIPSAAPVVAVVKANVMTATHNWTGPYAGLNIGYAFNGIALSNGSNFTSLVSGVAGGGQAGYDFQYGSTVVGVVADATYSSATYSGSDASLTTFKEPYNASLRLRAGYLVYEDTLIYLTGGYAVNRQNVDLGTYSINDGRLLSGYSVGAGLERFITNKVSAFSEYRYSNYNSESYDFNGTSATGAYNESEIRLGLNYRF